MEEVWKPIIIDKNGELFDYTGLYEISNYGRIRSLDRIDSIGRKVESRMLKFGINNRGYHSVNLCKDGKQKMFQVHRLVATMFIPNPDNHPVVNHKDENPSNNCVDNLEWMTQKENVQYSAKPHSEGTKRKISEAQKGKILSEEHKQKLREKAKSKKVVCLETNQIFDSLKEAQTWLGKGNIANCLRGQQKTAGGYHWQYYEDYLAQQNDVESF